MDTAELHSWNVAVRSAYDTVVLETGKNTAQLAGDMGIAEYTLQRYVSGKLRWSLDAMLRLASASGQDPIRMLTREGMP